MQHFVAEPQTFFTSLSCCWFARKQCGCPPFQFKIMHKCALCSYFHDVTKVSDFMSTLASRFLSTVRFKSCGCDRFRGSSPLHCTLRAPLTYLCMALITFFGGVSWNLSFLLEITLALVLSYGSFSCFLLQCGWTETGATSSSG